MRATLVVGNWKMNGGLASNAALLSSLSAGWKPRADREMAVCVPFPYLAQARERLEGGPIAWGSQDVSEHASGAYTGEVAAAMIAEFGARYALAGHSERRQYHGEGDAKVAAKSSAPSAAPSSDNTNLRSGNSFLISAMRATPGALVISAAAAEFCSR